MMRVAVGFVLIIVGVLAFVRRKPVQPGGKLAGLAGLIGGPVGGGILTLIGLFLLASTSFVLVHADRSAT